MVGMYPELERWAAEEALARPKESLKEEARKVTDPDDGGGKTKEDPCDVEDQSTHFICSR
jgi:hypothetical protein